MKKIEKYLTFLPFAVFIGSILIYLFYTLKIRFSKRVIITTSLTNVLNKYLIIALISLLIGLIIVLIKKITNLIKEKPIVNKNITENINNEELKLNVSSSLSNKTTDKLLNKDKNYNKKDFVFKLDGISCVECGGLISKKAAICPHCGIMYDEEILRILNNKMTNKTKNKVKKNVIVANICLILLFAILIFLISNLLINKSIQNKNNINHVVINEENM